MEELRGAAELVSRHLKPRAMFNWMWIFTQRQQRVTFKEPGGWGGCYLFP